MIADVYNKSMSNEQEVGSFIDLSYLNGVLPRAVKKSTEAIHGEQEVGTHFSFRKVGDSIKKFRQIPVSFA